MDNNKMDFIGASDRILNFAENELTNKLVEIYKSTGISPFDTLEFLLCHLDDETNREIIINKANKLTEQNDNERPTD